MIKTAKYLCGLLLCMQLTACTQWRWDLGEALYSIELPQPEQNVTLTQAMAIYGPPQRISASDSGYILAWEHWHIREDSFGISLGAMGAEFMSADWGEMGVKGEFVLLTFDRNLMLSGATRSKWDNHGGGGKAIQPFFGFVSVVDAGDLSDRMPQHRWGGTLMQRLPTALNSNASPNTGQNALEQRGTPPTMGQRTLEMN